MYVQIVHFELKKVYHEKKLHSRNWAGSILLIRPMQYNFFIAISFLGKSAISMM